MTSAEQLWGTMSEEEKEYALLCISEMDSTGTSRTLKELVDADYLWEPPSIREFLENPYYAGAAAQEMYPLLKENLIEIFEGNYEEVILTGAIGFGKSWVSSFGLAYDLVCLLSLRSPQQFYGLASSSDIVMMNLSVTGGNAHDVLWSYVFNLVKDMPWSMSRFPNRDWKKLGLAFPDRRIHFRSGSSSEFSAIGANVIGGAMDEANFMIGARRSKRAVKAGEVDQARVLYNQLSRRRQSRFLQPSGRLPSHFWLISSKQFPGDFLEARIEESKGNPYVKVIDYPQWTPRKSLPHGGPYSGKNFLLFVGTAENRSRIISEDASKIDTDKIVIPPNCKLMEVPIEYLQQFKEDLYGSIRDIAGHSILAINPFFDRLDCYEKCVLREDLGDSQRVHPYEFEETDVISPHLIKWHDVPTSYNQRIKLFQPGLHPDAKRYAHIDLSQTGDATGVSIGHYGGHKRIRTMLQVEDPVFGSKFVEVMEDRPTTIFDFIMRFVPPMGGRIDIEQVRLILKAFAERLNWVWGEVTYDQYQSATSIAAWNAENVKSYVYSVDRTPDAYEMLRSSMYQERCSYYPYPPLKRDMASLDWDAKKRKVDHRPGGTKDVTDGCAAVVEHVERNNPAVHIPYNAEVGMLYTPRSAVQKHKLNFQREVSPGTVPQEIFHEKMDNPEWDPLENLDTDDV